MINKKNEESQEKSSECKNISNHSIPSTETINSKTKRLKTESNSTINTLESTKSNESYEKSTDLNGKNLISETQDIKNTEVFKPVNLTTDFNKNIFKDKIINEKQKESKSSQFLIKKEIEKDKETVIKKVPKKPVDKSSLQALKNVEVFYLDDDEWLNFAQGNVFIKNDRFIFIRGGFATRLLDFELNQAEFIIEDQEIVFTHKNKKYKIVCKNNTKGELKKLLNHGKK